MTIQVVCNGCKSALNVKDSMAGLRGKCPKCGSAVQVPSIDRGQSVTPLSMSSSKQMVAELWRRGKSVVLLEFDTPLDGDYRLHERENWSVNCIGSDDMSMKQLKDAIAGIAKLSDWHDQGAYSSPGEESKTPYDLKGDQLGMTLEEFKRKYHRVVDGHNETAPYTSEYRPRQRNESLFADVWHTDAGIVHCSIEFPFERYNGKWCPTIAGTEVDVLLYKFVDGLLFQISAYFDTRRFDSIRYSLADKYGVPVKEDKKPVRLFWWNGISSISLRRGRISPKEWSQLDFTHHKLLQVVTDRTPGEADL
jgi:hypothetical protein